MTLAALADRFITALRRGDKEDALAAVQEGLDHYNRRELGTILEFLEPDVEWIPPPHSLEDPQRGHAAVREMFDRWFEGWRELRVEVEDVFADGELVVVFVRQVGRGLTSGIEVSNRVSFLWRIDGGKVTRFEVFPRRTAALAAAGLGAHRLAPAGSAL